MSNNDILKKLRVALQLRDDQIVDILKLVDFNVSKAEIGALFRNEDHPTVLFVGEYERQRLLALYDVGLLGLKLLDELDELILGHLSPDFQLGVFGVLKSLN